MQIGLVLLSFGIGKCAVAVPITAQNSSLSPPLTSGSLLGSLLGGRYSDYIFNGLKARNGGVGYPEVRSL